MKKVRRRPNPDPERLTTRELLTAHERMFGPLEPQAKARMLRAVETARPQGSWDGMDGLAA